MTPARETFDQQVRSNKRRSILLIVAIVAILGAISWFIGFAIAGDPTNAIWFVPIGGLLALALSHRRLLRRRQHGAGYLPGP